MAHTAPVTGGLSAGLSISAVVAWSGYALLAAALVVFVVGLTTYSWASVCRDSTEAGRLRAEFKIERRRERDALRREERSERRSARVQTADMRRRGRAGRHRR